MKDLKEDLVKSRHIKNYPKSKKISEAIKSPPCPFCKFNCDSDNEYINHIFAHLFTNKEMSVSVPASKSTLVTPVPASKSTLVTPFLVKDPEEFYTAAIAPELKPLSSDHSGFLPTSPISSRPQSPFLKKNLSASSPSFFSTTPHLVLPIIELNNLHDYCGDEIIKKERIVYIAPGSDQISLLPRPIHKAVQNIRPSPVLTKTSPSKLYNLEEIQRMQIQYSRIYQSQRTTFLRPPPGFGYS
jgi:hypothetical protein